MVVSSPQAPIPLSRWFGTNEPLPHDDLASLNSLLEAQASELAKLDSEIEDLQRAIESRRPRQRTLRDAVDGHRRLMTPGRRLPTEVLQQIFLYCRTTRRLPLFRKEEAPMLLTRVCRYWRHLALDMPDLWDRIHIPIGVPFDLKSNSFYLGCAERWLRGARDNPLTVSIFSACSKPSEGDGSLERFVREEILARAQQIKHLILEADHPFLNLIGDTLPPASWEKLEKITLRRIGDFFEGPVPGLKGVWELPIWKAPSLRRIEWVSVKEDMLALDVTWSKFEEIRIEKERGLEDSDWDEYSASEAHAFVRDNPNIRNFKISLNANVAEFLLDEQINTSAISWDTPLVLPHLTTLELADVYVDPALNPIAFLHGLQLPALETLSYQLTTRPPFMDDEGPVVAMPHGDGLPLISFLRAQKQPIGIKSFRVPTASSMSQDDFVECLRMMPLLERVWVGDRYKNYRDTDRGTGPEGDICANARLLKIIQPPSRDPEQVLCPKLHSVKFDRMEEVEFEDVEAFVTDRLALARAFPLQQVPQDESETPKGLPSVARLQRLYIGFTNTQPDHVPRNYSRGRPSCALEEDLWEQGVDARILLCPANYDQDMQRYDKETYKPYEGVNEWEYDRSGPSVFDHLVCRNVSTD